MKGLTKINGLGSLRRQNVKELPLHCFKGLLDCLEFVGQLGAVQGGFPPRQESICIYTSSFSHTFPEHMLKYLPIDIN